jgi:DNA-binding PadR family transcriptional regulator
MTPVFRHGRLRLYLLKLLDEAPRHGYEVIRLLQDRFMGVYAPSPGTIYPRLARLEEEGLVTHDEVDGRKVYRITDKGREEIAARLDDLADLEEEITESVRDIAREVTEDVRDTVRNLREELTWASREVRDSKERARDTAREKARRAREEVRDSARQARDELHSESRARQADSGEEPAGAGRERAGAGRERAGAGRPRGGGEQPGAGHEPGDWAYGPGLARLDRLGQPGWLARLG